MGKTNKIIAELNMENIISDFDIYLFSAISDKAYNTNILDLPIEKYKALSVQHKYGKKAYVLFKKGTVASEEFILDIQENNSEVTVHKITDDELMDPQYRIDNFYYGDRLLVQLLLNSLAAPRNELMMYNNITGKLLYTDSSWKYCNKTTGEIYSVYFVNASLDAGMFLNLHVETYKRCNENSTGSHFVFDEKTGRFRRKLSSDSGNIVFQKANFEGKHNTVVYFDISSASAFAKSKLGIFEKCLSDAEKKLGKYMKLAQDEEFVTTSFALPKCISEEKRYAEYGRLINELGVVIVDDNNTEKSKELALKLKEELKKYFGIISDVGELDKSKYNIRIIHSEKFYKDNDLLDPHEQMLTGYIIQHVVEEEKHFGNNSKASPDVVKIVQELLIKGDIFKKRISLFDWCSLATNKTWTFVKREKIRRPYDRNSKTHINLAGKPVFDYWSYACMSVDNSGNIMFDTFTDEDIDLSNDNHMKIIKAYDMYVSDIQRFDNVVEGLVYSNVDNIHVIVKTPEQTMPDISAMFEALKETDKKKTVCKEDLLDGIDSYLENDLPEADIKMVNDLKDYIVTIDEKMTIEVVHKGFNMKKDCFKRLNRYLRDNHGIWISHEIKDSDTEEEFNYDNLLDIKYAYRTEYDGKNCFSFFVGNKRNSVKYSIHKGCPIRKVYSQTETLEYEELLPLHSVDFVRNKQHTVLPFPFKYMREYMQNNGMSGE